MRVGTPFLFTQRRKSAAKYAKNLCGFAVCQSYEIGFALLQLFFDN